jgi:uncharacterized protein VirK/YbjX
MLLLPRWFGARPQWLADFTKSFATIQHAGRAVYPGTGRFHQWRRLRFCLRSLLFWRTTMTWLRRCSTPPLSSLAQRQPSALERMHRPFLHGNFSSRERLRASLDHDTLTRQRAPQLAMRIAVDGHVSIAHFSVGMQRWSILLELSEKFQREGDWTLCIRDALNRRVVSCAFSFAYLGGKVRRPRMCIGSVQGPDKSMEGRELFRTLTKQWHGLRPKVFMIYLAQCVAHSLDISGTFIVSKHAHVSANWRYCLRKKRVSADYDSLSQECGARARWNGWFVLPPPALYVADRTDADKGNAMHRKRHALKAAITSQIRERLAR